jgi:hypothetical protein
MPVYMVESTESSVFELNQPDAGAIDAAWARSAVAGGSNGSRGAWVGPVPKITRQAVLGAFKTFVAQPYSIPDGTDAATVQAILTILVANLRTQLATVSPDFTDATTANYDAAVNGPLASWQSGAQQGTSNTTGGAGTGLGRVLPPDNPTGPNPPAPSLGTFVGGLAVVGGVVLVGVVAFNKLLR